MPEQKKTISSGVLQLDRMLGGLYIGDNVLWYDDAGSLASIFCMNFIRQSQAHNKSIIYVSFDRSPKNLHDKLGRLAENQHLTILDCFTNGKGDGSAVFNKFYEKDGARWPYPVIKVSEPWKPEKVSEAVYGLHKTMTGDVRLVFESLTGMQDLWGGEEHVLRFYSRACPRLYELDTIAYWVIERKAHSSRLQAHINQIAQVAIELSIKRGKSALTVRKAENRDPDNLNKACHYYCEGLNVEFQDDRQTIGKFAIGAKIKSLRKSQGVSQKELARRVGVTPSTISQVESNQIYPSLPALFKIAEILSVDIGAFLEEKSGARGKSVFPAGSGVAVGFSDVPGGGISGERLVPPDLNTVAEPYRIRIAPGRKIAGHFFGHKGEEMGYLLSGRLHVTIRNRKYSLRPGDTVYLTVDTPAQWENPDEAPAEILWIKAR
jgi:DNA-binding XRE family transcriptional regulator/KaiC/GvpD/RAD55 family RecA-like ATPase/quercetin dioxygenase-like cupin family protein